MFQEGIPIQLFIWLEAQMLDSQYFKYECLHALEVTFFLAV